jgi:UMF1 family MFS transporter
VSSKIKKGDKKIINAWVFYDWANSVYPLVITSTLFPIYYEKVTPLEVEILGRTFVNTELYSYVGALSFLLVAIFSPLLSGIADYSGSKKRFLQFFCYLGSIACMGLYWFNAEYLTFSLFIFLLASIGYWSSLVFYNAYLPEIAEPDEQNNVSARGFAMGYLGSSILLILILVAIMKFEMPAKFGFLLTGFWWITFSQYTYIIIPSNLFNKKPTGKRYILSGYREINKVWNELKTQSVLKRFLIAFFFFSMGVQTVLFMAALFATQEIKNLPEGGLIIVILIIQFVAIIGAYLFSWLGKKTNNILSLNAAILIWIVCCVSAYKIENALPFYFLAAGVGLVMGGIQSLSRSTYSQLLPETQDHASYFSFYDATEKIAYVVGTFSFGYINGITGSMRDSILALISFFITGFILLAFIKRKSEKLQ